MALSSMTGFARAETQHGPLAILIEARCVNGRSSDVKLRLPSGMDHLDKPIRQLFQVVVRRGNANVSVTLQREATRVPRINTAVLAEMRTQLADLAAEHGETPPRLCELLNLPGVIDMVDPLGAVEDDGEREARDAALLACAANCADLLKEARQSEGAALNTVLSSLVDQMESELSILVAHPHARGEHLMNRLRAQLTQLVDDQDAFSSDRLHQEAALLATKADIEEEVARLTAHIAAARDLFNDRDPVGRRLDFLAQECNREANTICSKASSIEVTQHGLALKALVDQFKEQVQNVE